MTIKAIVRSYVSQIRPRAQEQLQWFRQQPSLESAIELAALAINSQHKRYAHQRRLKKTTLENARTALLTNMVAIQQAGSFDNLFTIIDAILEPINGIGELYVYDVTLRIGAKLGLLPTKVYLHSGARIGARKLGLDGKAKALEVTALPLDFGRLEPYEIEDALCIFKDDLAKASTELTEVEMAKRSWCN